MGKWEYNRTPAEQTELKPTFWNESNRTRTDMPKEYVELEANRTCKREEPERNQDK